MECPGRPRVREGNGGERCPRHAGPGCAPLSDSCRRGRTPGLTPPERFVRSPHPPLPRGGIEATLSVTRRTSTYAPEAGRGSDARALVTVRTGFTRHRGTPGPRRGGAGASCRPHRRPPTGGVAVASKHHPLRNFSVPVRSRCRHAIISPPRTQHRAEGRVAVINRERHADHHPDRGPWPGGRVNERAPRRGGATATRGPTNPSRNGGGGRSGAPTHRPFRFSFVATETFL